MTLSAGTRLGVFEILAPLGKDGRGEVYRAKDMKLGREVAIKQRETRSGIATAPQGVDNPEQSCNPCATPARDCKLVDRWGIEPQTS